MTVQFPKQRFESFEREEFPSRPLESFGTGTIGVLCGEQARWSQFMMALIFLQSPPGWKPCIDPGVDIVKQCNNFVRFALKTDSEFLFIMGDDHVFHPQILHRLLEADVDVIVPNCLQRSAPFNPVVYGGEQDGRHMVKMDLPERGIHHIHAAGSAGMLIKRKVLEALPEDPFMRSDKLLNEDLTFCRLVRRQASSSGSMSRRRWRTSARWSSGRSGWRTAGGSCSTSAR